MSETFIERENQDGTVEYVNPNYDALVAVAESAPVSEPFVISDEEIAEHAATQYQRDRKAKYDALNQLELISDDAINGTTTHKDAILAIKAEIPKETI